MDNYLAVHKSKYSANLNRSLCRARGASTPLTIETKHSQLVPSSEIKEKWGVSQTDSVRDNILIMGSGISASTSFSQNKYI